MYLRYLLSYGDCPVQVKLVLAQMNVGEKGHTFAETKQKYNIKSVQWFWAKQNQTDTTQKLLNSVRFWKFCQSR